MGSKVYASYIKGRDGDTTKDATCVSGDCISCYEPEFLSCLILPLSVSRCLATHFLISFARCLEHSTKCQSRAKDTPGDLCNGSDLPVPFFGRV